MLEENGSEIKYVKDPDNDTSDALTGLLLMNSDIKKKEISREHLAGIFFSKIR